MIGRVHKTIHILKTLDDEEYCRQLGRELNNGAAARKLSRFLCGGKEGHLRSREFGDPLYPFGCLSVLHTAVVAWNMLHIGRAVEELRAEWHVRDEATYAPNARLHGSRRVMWIFGWMWLKAFRGSPPFEVQSSRNVFGLLPRYA